MSELHTDDTFMYENCLVGDASGMDEDPLVNRITHQRGPEAPSTESIMSRHKWVNWSQAPNWAAYWAMDSNGEAYWFESKPTINATTEIFNQPAFTKAKRAPSFRFPVSHWQESRTERPLNQAGVQEQALDELVRDAEELGLYDDTPANESEDPMHRQVSGSHYNKYLIQPAEYCYKNGLNNLQSEAISYITRYGDKGGKTDLEKAIHTLEMLIHMEYGE